VTAHFSAQVQLGWQAGMLSAQPGEPSKPRLPAGLRIPFGAGPAGSALFVPRDLDPGPAGLVVLLHGATSTPEQVLPILRDEAERRQFLLLAPKSRDYTWDIIRGGFGPDVAVIDRLLTEVFVHFEVNPARIALAGFSDGASYALSVGLINGELFSRILAFSPGFMVPGRRRGKPNIFISHGDADTVLPIQRCSRRIVPQLLAEGYQVDYHEFEDGHSVPAELAAAAVEPLAELRTG
jgi:phospholipase/carboxylesterase